VRLLRTYLSEFGMANVMDSPPPTTQLGPRDEEVDTDRSCSSGGTPRRDAQPFFVLDPVTIRDLDIFRPTGSASAGRDNNSLFWILNHCRSKVGRRTLREWIAKPLKDCTSIVMRQDLVAWISTHAPESALQGLARTSRTLRAVESNGQGAEKWLMDLTLALSSRDCPDPEQLLSSLQHGRISPRKLLQILRFAASLTFLCSTRLSELINPPPLLQQMLTAVDVDVDSLLSTTADFLGAINVSAAAQNSVVEVFSGETVVAAKWRSSKRTLLMEKRLSIEEELQKELMVLRKSMNMPNLQYKSLRTGPLSSIDGLIEIPVNLHRSAPMHWVEVNATKQVRRYHPPEVVRLLDQLEYVKEEIKSEALLEWKKAIELCNSLLQQPLRRVIRFLGELDCLLSLAVVSRLPGYIRPVYSDSSGNE
jgi:DNA mismatch repair protein MSH3